MPRPLGGLSTKLHATCDALGNPTSSSYKPDLVQHVHAEEPDAQERVLAILEKAEVTIVIPPKADRSSPAPMTSTSIRRAI